MNTTSDISTAAAALGRKGGKSTTEAKVTAARSNGAAGGRPRERYELTFVGSASVRAYRIPRHRRYHTSLDSAREAARATHAKMQDHGLPTACHQAIIYGPGCGRDGIPA